MELKSIEYINPIQAIEIEKIYKGEFKELCKFSVIGSEERCSFTAYVIPEADDKIIYIRLVWSYQNDEGYIGVNEKFYCVEEFGAVQTFEEKYIDLDYPQKMSIFSKLQKLDWL
jgi:hypothetical protein